GKSYQLTDGMSDVLYPAFDKGGKYLYFTASTNTALSTGWLDMSSLEHPVHRSVYVMVLRKDTLSPLAPESDEEKSPDSAASDKSAKEQPAGPDKDKDKDKGKEEKPVTVEIDLDNISQRVLALPIPARNYSRLTAGKAGTLYLLEAPAIDPIDFED